MVIYADKIKLMFIHAPKTAGSSMARTLKPWITGGSKRVTGPAWQGTFHRGAMHDDYQKAHGEIDPRLKKGWTLISTVRNPFTLMQSLHERFGEGMNMGQFVRAAIAKPKLCRLCGVYFERKNPFSHFIGPADPVLRFEFLDLDFAALCRQVGFEATIPLHLSNYEPEPHTADSIEVVKRHFDRDLERWGYTALDL